MSENLTWKNITWERWRTEDKHRGRQSDIQLRSSAEQRGGEEGREGWMDEARRGKEG